MQQPLFMDCKGVLSVTLRKLIILFKVIKLSHTENMITLDYWRLPFQQNYY
jgi:hypothetical protein